MTVKDKKIMISQALQDAREMHLLRMELFAASAADTKAQFDAYVSAGFNTDQALRLCCANLSKGSQ